MSTFKRMVWMTGWAALFAVVITAVPTGSVQAGYLDPGSSSLIIQFLVGGILTVLVAVKMYWGRITGFFTGKEPAAEDQSSLPGDDIK